MLNRPERGIRVVDLFERAGMTPARRHYRDTMHLKPAAYQQLGPALAAVLRSFEWVQPEAPVDRERARLAVGGGVAK